MNLLEGLAALIYYDQHKGTEGLQFEKLEEGKQKELKQEAQKFLVYLDKLNMTVVTKESLKNVAQDKNTKKTVILNKIKEWVKELRHPKGVQLYLNDDVCVELANRIIIADKA